MKIGTVVWTVLVWMGGSVYARPPADRHTDLNDTIRSACTDPAIDRSVREGRIRHARELAEALYRRCPERRNARLYAKLAFWDKDIRTAYSLRKFLDPESSLFRQISASHVIREIERGKRPDIPDFLQEDYDVIIARIRASIRRKNFENAYRLSRILYRKYRSREALELQANLLLWMERYRESLPLFSRLGNAKRVEEIRQIILDRKLEETNRRIRKAWFDSDRTAARKIFDGLSEKERTLYRKKYRQNACRVETMHMLGMGFDQVSYSDHRYRDHTDYLEFTLPVENYTLYGKLEQTDRYRMKDRKLSMEIYPPGRNGYWGYFSFSVTPDADFYSRYSAGAYLYREFEREQIGFGYLFSHYDLQDSQVVQLDFTHYLSDYMTLRGVSYYDLVSHSYALLGEWRYTTPCHLDLKGTYVYSSSNELLQDTRMLHDRGHNFQFDLEYPLGKSLSIGGRLLWQQSLGENRYTTRGVSLFIRTYW